MRYLATMLENVEKYNLVKYHLLNLESGIPLFIFSIYLTDNFSNSVILRLIQEKMKLCSMSSANNHDFITRKLLHIWPFYLVPIVPIILFLWKGGTLDKVRNKTNGWDKWSKTTCFSSFEYAFCPLQILHACSCVNYHLQRHVFFFLATNELLNLKSYWTRNQRSYRNRKVCILPRLTPRNWQLGLVKNKTLRQERWLWFSNCKLSVHV